jgi:hypothetical protein
MYQLTVSTIKKASDTEPGLFWVTTDSQERNVAELRSLDIPQKFLSEEMELNSGTVKEILRHTDHGETYSHDHNLSKGALEAIRQNDLQRQGIGPASGIAVS